MIVGICPNCGSIDLEIKYDIKKILCNECKNQFEYSEMKHANLKDIT